MDDLLTVAEFARRLRLNDTTVRRWILNGVLPPEEVVLLPGGRSRPRYRLKASALARILGEGSVYA